MLAGGERSLKVPAEVTVTERAWKVFEKDPGVYASVQSAIFRYFSLFQYVPGSAEEQFRSFLLDAIRSELDFGVFATTLHQIIGSYHLAGISPVRILVSSEEESGNGSCEAVVAVFPGMSPDALVLGVQKALQHAASERTKECFTVSGIWDLGKSAFFGRENKTVEKAFFLFQQEKYEASLSLLFLGQGSSAALPLSLCLSLLCRHALGMEQEDAYVQPEPSGLVDALIILAIRLLYLKLPKKEIADEQRKKGCLALQMMVLECPLEASLGVLLKKYTCSLINGLPSLAPLLPGLLVLLAEGLAQILEESMQCGATELLPFWEYIENIYNQTVVRSTHPEMKACALALLAGATSSAQRKKDILPQVFKVPGWARYKRPLIKLLPEKKQVICVSASWSLKMSLIYPKDTRVQARSQYAYAHMKYVGEPYLSRESRVFPGQTVRIRIGIRGMRPEKASLFLSGEEYAMTCNGIYVSADVPVVRNREFALEYVIFLESGVFFRIEVNKELEVLQIRYLLPRLQYRKRTPKWGVCRILAEGCASLSSGVYPSPENGNKGYKKASLQRFFVRDALGFVFLVLTPHVYTDEKKPKIRIKHFPNGKYAISVKCPLPFPKCGIYCLSYRPRASRAVLTRLRAKKHASHQTPTLFPIPDSYTTRYLENEDDAVPSDRPDTFVPEIETGVCNAFLGNGSRIFLDPLLQAVRERFFRDDQILWSRHTAESFTDITYYPPVAGTDPVILIRTKRNLMITRLPLEKRKTCNPYTLWTPWSFFHDVLHGRVCNGKKHTASICGKKEEGLLFYSLVTTDITTETKWFCKGLSIRCTRRKPASVSVCLLNHSLFLHFFVILEMRAVHVRPLERVYHETSTSPENISVTVMPLE